MGISIIQKILKDNLWKQQNALKFEKKYSTEPNKQNLMPAHKVDSWERRFLVWTGKYKSIKDVPDFVSQTAMERTRNLMRIKIANYMMLATALGCALMVYLGKQDAKAGKSVQQANLDWHKKFNEDQKKAGA